MLKKLLYIFLILNLQSAICNLYAQSITWQRLFPDYYGTVKKVQQTFDGGYIAVGRAIINNNDKIGLIKFNTYGDTLWTRVYGVGSTRGNWVEQTSDMGFIIGGVTDSGQFYNKAYLIKTDSLGNIQWQRTYNNLSSDDGCNCVRQTSENGFILSCVSFPDLQNRKAYIIKTDFGGNIIWQKLYGDGITDLVIFELQPLNGGYVITGFKEVGTLSSDLLLMKLNLNGDTLWTRIFGGNDVDIGYSVIPTPFNSGYLIAGYTRSFSVNGKLESYIVKTDSNGILQWQRSYSNLGWEGAFSVRYKPGLGYAFAGYSDSLNNNVYNAKLRAIDLLGNLLLETSFHPGIDDAGFNSLELTTDGGFILGGNEESSLGGSHIYVVKTDSLGFANPIGIESIGSAIPVNFKLHQNYPNPFNPLTTIKFDIPSAGTVPRTVRLVIYDMLGREIAVLVNENLKPGSYEVKWDASNFASGMYFYKLKNGGFTQTKKMVLIK